MFQVVKEDQYWTKLTGMRQGVKLQFHFLIEAASANNAHIWLSVRMDLDVSMKIRNSVERFPAFIARIGLDSCVGEFVPGQVARLSESSATDITLKRFLSRVNTLKR